MALSPDETSGVSSSRAAPGRALDALWTEAVSETERLIRKNGDIPIAVPKELLGVVPGAVAYGADARAVLLHKADMYRFPVEMLRRIASWSPFFANQVFVLFVADKPARGLLTTLLHRRKNDHVKAVSAHLDDIERRRFTGRQQTVLIHVPKTAGTALIHAVARGSLQRPLHLFDPGREVEIAREHFPAYDFIASHFSFSHMQRHLPGANYLSVLRDPLDRLVSFAGHARRVQQADHLSQDMQHLRRMSLREWFDKHDATKELFIANLMLTGQKCPSLDIIRERLDRIDIATMVGMPQFLRRNATILGLGDEELPRVNVTANRSALVPQAEIDELVAAHGSLIEEARVLYDVVRQQELALEANGSPCGDGRVLT